ncbi:MAG: heavy metal sensor histidine kinase [Tepidisphaeraceae bacterium]|jgi:two-component system heavy metal sensor histidine kinase CusS
MSSKTGAEPASPPAQRRTISLALRLTAFYTTAASILLLAASVLVYMSIQQYLQQDDDDRLENKLREVEAIIKREAPDMESVLRDAIRFEYVAENLDPFLIRVEDSQGRVITETPKMGEPLPRGIFPAFGQSFPPNRPYPLTGTGGHAFRARSVKISTPSGRELTIHGAADHDPETHLLARYRRILWIANALGLLTSAFVGQWIAQRGLRPLDEMGEAVLRISSSTLDQRLPSDSYPHELGRLAEKFNRMLQGLEDAFARLARYSADIAHELRTPINNVRGEAEVALSRMRTPDEYREVLGSSLEECQRLGSLIDSLLFVARVENPSMRIKREQLDVRAEIEAIVEYYEAPASEHEITIEHQVANGLRFSLDRHLFRRAVGNLVENSLKYCSRGGRVAIRADMPNGTLRVAVSDNGRGIPAESLPHIFDRFYRVDVDRSKETGGHGLGLAIVKTIASLHHGEVGATSELGKGTTVTVVFGVPESAPAGP